MSPPKKGQGGVHLTRSNTDHFLVGQEQTDLGSEAKAGKLPKTRAVLQYMFNRKNSPKNNQVHQVLQLLVVDMCLRAR